MKGGVLSWTRSAHMNFMRRLANKTILQFCSVLDITTWKVRALRKTYSKRGASMSGGRSWWYAVTRQPRPDV